jgi:hypothetical protein
MGHTKKMSIHNQIKADFSGTQWFYLDYAEYIKWCGDCADKEEEHENAQALADGHDEIMLAFLEMPVSVDVLRQRASNIWGSWDDVQRCLKKSHGPPNAVDLCLVPYQGSIVSQWLTEMWRGGQPNPNKTLNCSR